MTRSRVPLGGLFSVTHPGTGCPVGSSPAGRTNGVLLAPLLPYSSSSNFLHSNEQTQTQTRPRRRPQAHRRATRQDASLASPGEVYPATVAAVLAHSSASGRAPGRVIADAVAALGAPLEVPAGSKAQPPPASPSPAQNTVPTAQPSMQQPPTAPTPPATGSEPQTHSPMP